jgi:ABC-2 type transport system ATP-binding protein
LETVLKFEGVTKRFGKHRALDGLDLAVPQGSAFGLVGSNGAGKTTSFSVASGLARNDAGKVDLLGLGPFSTRIHSGRVAVMPQDTQFQPYAKLVELLTVYAHLQGIPASKVSGAVEEVLDWVHLADRADAQIRTLSHGMRRRVVIAQAFLGSPELVLLDEPMSGLDPREVVNIRKFLRNRPRHQTVVVSSHNLHEIERICDHVAFIEKGKLVQQARMDHVIGRGHCITFTVGDTKGLDTSLLTRSLPDCVFEIVDDSTLICKYQDSKYKAHEVNGRVLEYLMGENAQVLEVRRGSDLESVYIAGGRQ